MGHQITALGTVDLTAMLGLITLADPIDIPEGASPRCYNVDFEVGSVLSRPGLQSIYTYAGTGSVVPPTDAQNINYIKSYIQNNGQIFTLVLDGNGIVWVEDVIRDPGVLMEGLSGIYAGSYGDSATADDQEYMLFSNVVQAVVSGEPTVLTMGYDRPRVVSSTPTGSGISGLQFLPLSQVGPGASPSFSTVAYSSSQISNFTVTSYKITNTVAELTYTPTNIPGTMPTAGQLLKLDSASFGPFLQNQIVAVLANSTLTPLTSTVFSVYVNAANVGPTPVSPNAMFDSPYEVSIENLDQNWDWDTYFPSGQSWYLSAAPPGTQEWQAIIQSNTSITNNINATGLNNPLPGTVVTVYYGPGSETQNSGTPDGIADPNFANFTLSTLPIYVSVEGTAISVDGTWLVTATGYGIPSSNDSHNWDYFAYNVTGAQYQKQEQAGTVNGVYWMTRATLVTPTPLIGISNGDTFTIINSQDSNQGKWNGQWTVLTSNAYVLSINSTQLSGNMLTVNFSIETGDISGFTPQQISSYSANNPAGGYVTITLTSDTGLPPGSGIYITGTGTDLDGKVHTVLYNSFVLGNRPSPVIWVYDPNVTTSASPANAWVIPINCIYGRTSTNGAIPGQFVTISGSTNFNGAFNTSGYIESTDGFGNFTMFLGDLPGQPFPPTIDTGQVVINGTIFIFDPGVKFANIPNVSAYYGPYMGSNARIEIPNPSLALVGSGVRQGTVYFITESGYQTAPAPPVQFTVGPNVAYITATEIPTGPPNVIARAIAFTEAGQNGQPGANFYVIPQPVTITDSFTGQAITYGATIIYDNVTTTANFAFSDAVLLASDEIDVQGNDLFNLIELGASAWCVPYSSRMFYGLQLNKVQNFNNYSFMGGTQGDGQPAGWTVYTGYTNQGELETNAFLPAIFPGETSLYILNSLNISGINSFYYQTAYQDAYNVNILNINTEYSVRVVASIPSGNTHGDLIIALQTYDQIANTFTLVSSFTIPFSTLSETRSTVQGVLLPTPFPFGIYPNVPSNLKLTFYVSDMEDNADILIYRIEVFPTQQPFLLQQVCGSYINSLESIDVSENGGVIDTSSENDQPCMGGFIMHDTMWLLKTSSIYTVEDNPSSEPGGWGLHEVSNLVGTCGIHSYDAGEEWFVTACRRGIFGFAGGQPEKIMQEIWQVWEALNWFYGSTIVLRNDIDLRKLYCAVPLPTPNQWLPYAPLNMNPTVPNVILMCNYQGLGSFSELVSTASAGMHTTMFGTLAAVDMKRKWTIWEIPTSYMDFVTQQDNNTELLYIGNGQGNSLTYLLNPKQYGDQANFGPDFGTVQNQSSPGAPYDIAWTNPQYVLASSDVNYAYANVSSGAYSYLLDVVGFGFPTQLYLGIIVSFTAYNSVYGMNSEMVVQLLKNGVPVGTAKTQELSGTSTTYYLGGPSDYWGATWEPTDFSNPAFGVQLYAIGQFGEGSVNVLLNNVQISMVALLPIDCLYTTYGFTNPAKAATVPLLGMHAKRYTNLQWTASGSGSMQVRVMPNLLADYPVVGQGTSYPQILPGVLQPSGLYASANLYPEMQDDLIRPLNTRGVRAFLEFRTNAAGDWFDLHKILLSGKADSWSPINPTGGGNVGFPGAGGTQQ